MSNKFELESEKYEKFLYVKGGIIVKKNGRSKSLDFLYKSASLFLSTKINQLFPCPLFYRTFAAQFENDDTDRHKQISVGYRT